MKSYIHNSPVLILVFVLALTFAALSCAAKETPTAAPAPTRAPAPAATPTAALPTPSRPLPTPTAIAIAKPQYGGTLKYATNLEVKSMDPANLTGESGRTMAEAIFEKLVDVDTQFNFVPGLARSWEIAADGKAITFHLVKGAKFQDGTDFNAQAVKQHFDRVMDPKISSRYRVDIEKPVEKITVNDDSTVTFYMKAPNRPFLTTLTDYVGFIESPTALQKADSYADPNTGKFGRNPVGTGPFRLKEWAMDDHMTATRFENYWERGLPYLDAFTITHVPDAQVRLAMVRTGEAEIIYNVRAADVPIARRNPNLAIAELKGGRFNSLGMSSDVEPWSNKALRQAIAYAIDRQGLVDSYFEGAGQPGYSPVTTGWASNPNIKTYQYDPKKAKEKLAEAGYPAGIAFPYWCQSTAPSLQLCEVTQAQLKAAGIDAKITPVASAVYWSMVLKREIHVIDRYRFPKSDPGQLLEILFRTKGGSNVMGYSNPQVDNLLDRAATIYDLAEAKKLYDQIQTMVVEDVAHVFTVWQTEFVIMNKRVQNFRFIPDLYLRMRDIWLEK